MEGMFEAGNILHGFFNLGKNGWKNKFVIVLHSEGGESLLMTFTTSQPRSSFANPVHGRNPQKGIPVSYVFKAGVEIGVDSSGSIPFSFKKDTTVVPDYGVYDASVERFCKSVTSLKIVCKLYSKEYEALVYTLYKSTKLKGKYKLILEKVLEKLYNDI